MFKGTKFLLLAVIAVFAVIFVSCGEGSGKKIEDPYSDTVPDDTEEDTIKSEAKSSTGFPANIQRWPIPGTGQHQCFDNQGRIPCPEPGSPFFGQDGNHQVGTRSYTVNESQGTVEDNVTGLMWQRVHKSGTTWAEAKSYCQNLSLGGFSNWRLPTTHEIKSLVDYGRNNPAIDTDAFPDTPNDWFWASSVRGHHPEAQQLAWIVGFIDGFVEYTARTNFYNVRCVRIN